jgi:hypothetical protein
MPGFMFGFQALSPKYRITEHQQIEFARRRVDGSGRNLRMSRSCESNDNDEQDWDLKS